MFKWDEKYKFIFSDLGASDKVGVNDVGIGVFKKKPYIGGGKYEQEPPWTMLTEQHRRCKEQARPNNNQHRDIFLGKELHMPNGALGHQAEHQNSEHTPTKKKASLVIYIHHAYGNY